MNGTYILNASFEAWSPNIGMFLNSKLFRYFASSSKSLGIGPAFDKTNREAMIVFLDNFFFCLETKN